MSTYDVEICRVSYSTKMFTVVGAKSQKEARDIVIFLIDVITCPFKVRGGRRGPSNPPLWYYIGGLTSQLTDAVHRC